MPIRTDPHFIAARSSSARFWLIFHLPLRRLRVISSPTIPLSCRST